LLLLFIFLANPVIRAWCLGALASTHTSGLALAALLSRERDPDLQPPTLAHRIALPLALWAIAAALVYWPLDGLINDTIARVVLVDGRNIIVNPRVDPDDLLRGDIILFRSGGNRYSGEVPVLMRDGLYWGGVIGLPGDQVTFSTQSVAAGGRSRPLEAYMPTTGSVAVPRDTWFAWPRMLQQAAGRTSPDLITHAFLDQAQITRAEFMGRPYRRWFFRRQDVQ
jgi:signal peptidase I